LSSYAAYGAHANFPIHKGIISVPVDGIRVAEATAHSLLNWMKLTEPVTQSAASIVGNRQPNLQTH
jgi:hypothetical protein